MPFRQKAVYEIGVNSVGLNERRLAPTFHLRATDCSALSGRSSNIGRHRRYIPEVKTPKRPIWVYFHEGMLFRDII